jgi:uncharacterized protein YjgD (DUF1641 family)
MSNEDLLLERLTHIEARLEGLDRVEKQLAVFAKPWDSLSDLGRDLSLLMEPATKKLTEELVEVEMGFQLEDVFALMKRLLPSLKYLTWSLEQLENMVDWWRDMEPLLKIAAPKFIDFLDDLEQKGIFRVNAAMLEAYGKFATRYDADDIATIGDGFVLMHGLVKKLSNPDVIQFLEKLTDMPLALNLEETQPVGPLGLLWKMRSPECRQGLGVMLELTRALGSLKREPEPSAAPG